MVILSCNASKNQGTGRPLSTGLRANMILLMNVIEEDVVLLHVSSFSPSTSRPYSPLVRAGSGFGLWTSSLAFIQPSMIHNIGYSHNPNRIYVHVATSLWSRDAICTPLVVSLTPVW
ncbi:hypothetical protein BDM02DRAFT_1228951 [Thelephora ganbajun]|uniref:Uncharacterized protein n=1 Tax=Thelephora ganbajun TaxID=370292 RepID=A0ACB6Z301_THEGA|nr:hypothetical protein BDM02DRAFT_1228951 [Thelephora ganbajun]